MTSFRRASFYNLKLTKGKLDNQDLVKKSFKFLLEREGPESILTEFALPQIQNYFSDYEQTFIESSAN